MSMYKDKVRVFLNPFDSFVLRSRPILCNNQYLVLVIDLDRNTCILLLLLVCFRCDYRNPSPPRVPHHEAGRRILPWSSFRPLDVGTYERVEPAMRRHSTPKRLAGDRTPSPCRFSCTINDWSVDSTIYDDIDDDDELAALTVNDESTTWVYADLIIEMSQTDETPETDFPELWGT